MIPGGTKDLDPNCAAAPYHRLRGTDNANFGMVNCEICGGEAFLWKAIDTGVDTPTGTAAKNTEARAIMDGVGPLDQYRLYKILKAIVLWQASMHGLTAAQARNAIADQYDDL